MADVREFCREGYQVATMRLVLLEDELRRTTAMRQRLQERFPQYTLVIVSDAPGCIAELRRSPDTVLAVSLDHDLLPPSGLARDPGTGRDVADFLAEQSDDFPRFPVVIHTTNLPAADGMDRVLTDAGYPVVRVLPFGDLAWIDERWFPEVRRCVVRPESLATESALPL